MRYSISWLMTAFVVAMLQMISSEAKAKDVILNGERFEIVKAEDVSRIFSPLVLLDGHKYACECVISNMIRDPFVDITQMGVKSSGSGIFSSPFFLPIWVPDELTSLVSKKLSARKCGNSLVYCRAIVFFVKTPREKKYKSYRLIGIKFLQGNQGFIENMVLSVGDLF